MIVQIDAKTELENPRNYAPGIIEELRALLTKGTAARLDSRRPNFFEIDNEQHTFFIHISPVSGRALLVAKWLRGPGNAYLAASQTQSCADFNQCR